MRRRFEINSYLCVKKSQEEFETHAGRLAVRPDERVSARCVAVLARLRVASRRRVQTALREAAYRSTRLEGMARQPRWSSPARVAEYAQEAPQPSTEALRVSRV